MNGSTNGLNRLPGLLNQRRKALQFVEANAPVVECLLEDATARIYICVVLH